MENKDKSSDKAGNVFGLGEEGGFIALRSMIVQKLN